MPKPSPLPGSFRRGLSPSFVAALSTGALRPLTDAVLAAELDLEVRRNYINVYDGKSSILKLSHHPRLRLFCASIHRAYKPPTGFTLRADSDYAEQSIPENNVEAWAVGFGRSIVELRRAAAAHDKPEGQAEFCLARANRRPPLLVIDRQVQLAGVRNSRVDLIGLRVDKADAALVLIELKQGTTIAVADVLRQVDRYRSQYELAGSLRPDVADCLQEILSFKRKLQLLHGQPPSPFRELPLEFLVVHVGSRTMKPGAPSMEKGSPTVHYLGLGMGEWAVPARDHWEVLRG